MYVGGITGHESERGNPGGFGLSSRVEETELEDGGGRQLEFAGQSAGDEGTSEREAAAICGGSAQALCVRSENSAKRI